MKELEYPFDNEYISRKSRSGITLWKSKFYYKNINYQEWWGLLPSWKDQVEKTKEGILKVLQR